MVIGTDVRLVGVHPKDRWSTKALRPGDERIVLELGETFFVMEVNPTDTDTYVVITDGGKGDVVLC
jgi:hypothetical protein